MIKKEYKQINETLYTETLPNGLTVYLLPKKDYHKTYGLFSTNYGSIDNEFVPLGETDFIHVPDGIAHFLEHKLFEKEDGDVFGKFGKQGASANAFTSFTKTSYLFSSTSQVFENLETLLDFVQEPYFTKESVDKEKGIIGQEIQMYQDDANWRLFIGLLENMYPKFPLSIDIVGTVESISKITAEDLYTCYRTFYHPSNMNLFVVGNLVPEEMMNFIRENQEKKEFAPIVPIKRRFSKQKSTDIIKERTINMSVTRPKFILGIKGIDELPKIGRELATYEMSITLFLQLLLGSTSKNYLKLYDAGLIDDTFYAEGFSLEREFHFAEISGDSDEPKKVIQKLEEILLNFESSEELTEGALDKLKKRTIGKYFQSLNSLEFIANQFSQNLYEDVTLFDVIEIVESLTMENILENAHHFIQKNAFSHFYIYPNEK
ncbi:MAG: insulinase family protein [Lactobacillales bacterium]|nr:insulinase family protein [Lactobacillales bacterium]